MSTVTSRAYVVRKPLDRGVTRLRLIRALIDVGPGQDDLFECMEPYADAAELVERNPPTRR